MRESIFFASIRAFFLTLSAVVGIIFGFLIVGIIVGLMSESGGGEPQITYTYSPEIKPNAKGIRKELSNDAPVILKIDLNGIIGSDSLSRNSVTQQLIESRERYLKDNRVKAILLCINSPGGSAIDADGIYRAVKAYKENYKIPVYAYVDGLCASGGMYVAAAADKIFASDVSLIGSVGVILSTALNFSQLMDKIGVQSLTLYDGKGKDNLNKFRPLNK
jgi:protease-4